MADNIFSAIWELVPKKFRWLVACLALLMMVVGFIWSTLPDSAKERLFKPSKNTATVEKAKSNQEVEIREIEKPWPPDRPQRIALIVGNSSYPENPLRNSESDATSVCERLKELGFKTILRLDTTRTVLTESIEHFRTLLSAGGIGVFYYSGHAFEIDRHTHLIPVDISGSILSENEAIESSVNLGRLIEPIDKIMDDHPHSTGEMVIYATRSGGVTLDSVVTHAKERGISVLIGESKEKVRLGDTSIPEGMVSPDTGTAFKNSPFTTALLKGLQRKDFEVFDLFRHLCREVPRLSRNTQIPWMEATINDEFFFCDASHDDSIGILRILLFDACRNNPFRVRLR